MIDIRVTRRRALELGGLFGLTLASLSVGCAQPNQIQPGTRLHGAWDMQYLGRALTRGLDPTVTPGPDAGIIVEPSIIAKAIQDYGQAGELPPSKMPTTSLDDLRKGTCHAVLLGREPTSDELTGLNDTVIALDAVCFLMDKNSFQGGEWRNGTRGGKTNGLRNLRADDLKAILSGPTLPSENLWRWKGGNYLWKQVSGPPEEVVPKPNDPSRKYDWVSQPADGTNIFRFPVGKYDTQTAIYQTLKIDEGAVSRVVAKDKSFTAFDKATEEEAVAFKYAGLSSVGYPFAIGFCSRRVAFLALDHVQVKGVSINGVDPMQNTVGILDGSYPFARKIHLMTLDPAPSDVQRLVDFAISPAGQKVIWDAGYVKVPVKQ